MALNLQKCTCLILSSEHSCTLTNTAKFMFKVLIYTLDKLFSEISACLFMNFLFYRRNSIILLTLQEKQVSSMQHKNVLVSAYK